MRRAVLALFAVLLVMPAAAFARTRYVCPDGRVMETPCCPSPSTTAHEPDAPTSLRAAPCCRLVRPVLGTQPARVCPAPVSFDHAIVPTSAAPPVSLVTPLARAGRAAALAPPRPSSLFVRHCALLL